METALELPYGTTGQISDVPSYVKRTSLWNEYTDLVIANNSTFETPDTHGMVYQYQTVYNPRSNSLPTNYNVILNEQITFATFSVTWSEDSTARRSLSDVIAAMGVQANLET